MTRKLSRAGFVLVMLLAGGWLLPGAQVNARAGALNLMELARSSPFHGMLNRTQAATALQEGLSNHYSHRYLQQYLGMRPRLVASVYADQLDVKFRVFDHFSRSPVPWSPEAARMKDFAARWNKVGRIEMHRGMDAMTGESLVFIDLEAQDGRSTRLPLELEPEKDGTLETIALALAILAGLEPVGLSVGNKPAEAAEIDPVERPFAVEAGTNAPPLNFAPPAPAPHPDRRMVVAPVLAGGQGAADETTIRQKLTLLRNLYEEGLLDPEVYRQKQEQLLRDL